MTSPRYLFGKQIARLSASPRHSLARGRVILGLVGVLLDVLASGPALAQIELILPRDPRQVPAPLPHLYWHVLTIQNRLDAEAAAPEAQGEDGSRLRGGNQRGLGFTDEKFAIASMATQRLRSGVSDRHPPVGTPAL